MSDVTPAAGPFQGYVDVCNRRYVAGWVRDLSDPAARVEIEVLAGDGAQPRTLFRGRADQYSDVLRQLGIGDARYAFHVAFDPPLDDADRDGLVVRPVATGTPIETAPGLQRDWMPLRFVAMDIVDNCNLRCPFCLYDYTHTHRTHMMDPAVYAATLRLLPFTTLGNFWLSCLHEPTLHPALAEFIQAIPRQYRRKVFYTTNLAKRMPGSYYEVLADSGLHNLNISLESRDPAIYERLRKGARFPIFMANWDTLLAAFAAGPAPPDLHYIVMAYRSNLAGVPGLVEYLRSERAAAQVQVRFTYPEPHIPATFAAAEFLGDDDWQWLREQLGHYPPNEVLLLPPPPPASPGATPPAPSSIRRRQNIEARIRWDGNVRFAVARDPSEDHDSSVELQLLRDMHISEIGDVATFLDGLVDAK